MKMNLHIEIDGDLAEDDKRRLASTAGLLLALSGVQAQRAAAPAAPAEAAAPAPVSVPVEPDEPAEKPKRGRPAKKGRSISDEPENREPETEQADAEQDAADEAAEIANKALPPIEELRAAMQSYQAKHGHAAFMSDIPALWESQFGAPPEGEAAWRVSKIAELESDKIVGAARVLSKLVADSTRFGGDA